MHPRAPEFPHLCEDELEPLRLQILRRNLCPTCRIMDRATCERCYLKLEAIFRVIHTAPLQWGEEGMEIVYV